MERGFGHLSTRQQLGIRERQIDAGTGSSEPQIGRGGFCPSEMGRHLATSKSHRKTRVNPDQNRANPFTKDTLIWKNKTDAFKMEKPMGA